MQKKQTEKNTQSHIIKLKRILLLKSIKCPLHAMH